MAQRLHTNGLATLHLPAWGRECTGHRAAHHTTHRTEGLLVALKVETQVYSIINATVWPEGRK